MICPECAYEWNPSEMEESDNNVLVIKDSNGTELKSGDSVTVVKDLKIKGSSSVIKVGTKIKNIKIVESDNEHNIDCKISGIGAIKVAQKFVKKI